MTGIDYLKCCHLIPIWDIFIGILSESVECLLLFQLDFFKLFRMDCNNGKEVKESVFMLDVQQLESQPDKAANNCSCSTTSGSAPSSPGFTSILSGASVINSDPSSPGILTQKILNIE
jgi:hypothetical protein